MAPAPLDAKFWDSAMDTSRRTPPTRTPQAKAVYGTFDTLIKGCSHSGDIDTAECLLKMMQECRETPTLDNYNAVVHACTQAGDTPRAQEYLLHMEEIGLTPNTVTYNLVINACASRGDAKQAHKWLLHMVARGLKPNEVTYGTICKVLARTGSVERIEDIMAQLEQCGLTLNEYFYASLISACGACNPPNLGRAERAFFEMVARGLRQNSVKRALARVVGERQTQQLFVALDPHSPECKSEAAKQFAHVACAGSQLISSIGAPPGLVPRKENMSTNLPPSRMPSPTFPVSTKCSSPAADQILLPSGVRTPPGLNSPTAFTN